MKSPRPGDAALLGIFVVLLAALLLRTFAPGIYLAENDRLGRVAAKTVTIRLGPEWEDARLAERAQIGDRANEYNGRNRAEILSIDTATARVRLNGHVTPGGGLSYTWFPLVPGGAIEIRFESYVLSGRIVAISE